MNQFVVLSKPPALSMANWQKALARLYQVLDRRMGAAQPCDRLHYRLSIDGARVLMHAQFDAADVTMDGVADQIQRALAPAYTLAQVRTALANNLEVMSHAEALAYIAANRAEWETAAP